MKLEFAVIQVGARLHYAVPKVLEEAGLLKVMYTDAHAGSPSLKLASLLPNALCPRALRRLLARKIPGIIPAMRLKSWAYPTIQQEWFNRTHPQKRKLASYVSQRQIGGHWLARKAIEDNFGGANALYVHPCACTEAVREAKRRGLFIVYEAISHPFNMREQKDEYERLGLPLTEGMDCIEENIGFFVAEAALADVVLAASEYVKCGLVEAGIAPDRIVVVPYGLESNFFLEEKPNPMPGRVLFVGTIDAHKGMAYYAQAARDLKAAGFLGDFRAIGPLSAPDVPSDPAFLGLNYIGQMPRSEVKQEFASADVFVFPTLTDGFGIVLLEALFAGLPIVCTPNCGDVVRDGYNGRIVPARDSAALASAIQEIVGNRSLRGQMSWNALCRRAEFTLEAYQRRLLDVVVTLAAKRKP